MASVLSGWYGYNLFNIANFIEYEPYPKRRKLDKQNGYRSVADSAADYELSHKDSRGGTSRMAAAAAGGSSIYRPYIENSFKHRSAASRRSERKQRLHHLHNQHNQPEVVHIPETEEDDDAAAAALRAAAEADDAQNGGSGGSRTRIDHLYPELLCLIFEKLDRQSKGRVAQVNICVIRLMLRWLEI